MERTAQTFSKEYWENYSYLTNCISILKIWSRLGKKNISNTKDKSESTSTNGPRLTLTFPSINLLSFDFKASEVESHKDYKYNVGALLDEVKYLIQICSKLTLLSAYFFFITLTYFLWEHEEKWAHTECYSRDLLILSIWFLQALKKAFLSITG